MTPPPDDLLKPTVTAEMADSAPPDTAAPDAFVEGVEMVAAAASRSR